VAGVQKKKRERGCHAPQGKPGIGEKKKGEARSSMKRGLKERRSVVGGKRIILRQQKGEVLVEDSSGLATPSEGFKGGSSFGHWG